jgi:hypothetical protein
LSILHLRSFAFGKTSAKAMETAASMPHKTSPRSK